MTEPPPWTLTARWIFPVSAPPLEGGLLTIRGERLLALEPARGRSADLDLGEAAVLPGLVNAHTHLDLSGLRGAIPFTGDFTAWLQAVIAFRRARSSEQVQADVRAGLAESIGHGVTLLGDISSGGASWPTLAGAPVRAVVFHELLGLPAARASLAWATALDWLRTHPATPTCRPGLSPHAPYSVRASLFRAAAALAAARDLPLATHLAETTAELQLLADRRGPFVPFLAGLGVWAPDGLVCGPDEVLARNAAVPHALFVHGNYLDPRSPLPAAATVVYCPRTHAFFQHSPHPIRELLARGARVALGTDSLASNPDLDVLAEARFLHRAYPDLAPEALLRLVTLAGAEALGWADEVGSLEPGKSADLAVVPLPASPTRSPGDPFHRVLASEQPVERVLCRGRWVHGAPGPPLWPEAAGGGGRTNNARSP